MTEEEWLSSHDAGTMLQHVRRTLPQWATSVARKQRLAALAFVRDVHGWDADRLLPAVVAAVESHCDIGGPFSAVNALFRGQTLDTRDLKRTLSLHLLTAALCDTDSGISASDLVTRLSRGTFNEPSRPSRQANYLRDIFGNPFRPVAFDPAWRTEHTVGLAGKMYEDRDFAAMPILADALQEAGCEDADILTHCREPGVHVRGCWVVDLVLGKA